MAVAKTKQHPLGYTLMHSQHKCSSTTAGLPPLLTWPPPSLWWLHTCVEAYLGAWEPPWPLQRHDTSPWPPAGSTAKASFNLQNLLRLCNGGLHFTKKFCFVKLHHMAYFYMKRQDLQKNCTDFQRCQLLRQLPKSLSAASENLTKQGGKGLLHGGLASLRPHPRWGLRPQPWGGFAPPNPPFPHPHTGMGGLCGFFKPKSLPQAWDGSQH